MADTDLQAELDSLFGSSEPKNEQPATPAPAPEAAAEPAPQPAPAQPAAPKSMMPKGGSKPMGKGFPKAGGMKRPAGATGPAPAVPAPKMPKSPSATGPAPKMPPAPVAPASSTGPVPPMPAAPMPGMPPMPGMIAPPPKSSAAGKISLVVSILCLLFIFVNIIMVNKVNARLDALTTAGEQMSKVQQQQSKEIDHMQKTQIKAAQRLHETLVDEKKSELQKNVRMTLEAVEMLRDKKK